MFMAMFIGEKDMNKCPLRVSKSDKIPEDDSFILTENSHLYECIPTKMDWKIALLPTPMGSCPPA